MVDKLTASEVRYLVELKDDGINCHISQTGGSETYLESPSNGETYHLIAYGDQKRQ